MNLNLPRQNAGQRRIDTNRRLLLFYGFIILIIVIIIARLFYLQIVRHDYYQKAALNDQLRQYTISADRGIIEAHEGNAVIPIVLDEKLYTLYADPTLVKNIDSSAQKLAKITGAAPTDYSGLMRTKNTRYVVLAKRLSESQKNRITALALPGIGAQAVDYRTYPQGSLASQVLGFVNDAGQGSYGIEQQFDKQLSGTPGMLKAITDANGVPLAANRGNVQIKPTPGDNITLTIDIAMQKKLEAILKQTSHKYRSKNISALIIDPNSGAIKAMANYPTFDPANFYKVKKLSVFSNQTVSGAIEVGSIMKSLSISTGLDRGVINSNTTYYDPGYVKIDGTTIKNVEPIPQTPTSIKDVLKFSLNTGAVHVFKELGGGKFDKKGRDIWHDYMTSHFQLGKTTGIELPDENPGTIPNPDKGYALNLKYADTAFGQGMSATILQMAAAFSSVINGGTYYRPHIVGSIVSPNGHTSTTKTKVVRRDAVSPATSKEMRGLLKYVFDQNYNVYSSHLHPGYAIGGKTGTAQIADPNGGYYTDKFNGTFLGFVGGDKPQYAVAVMVNEPDLPGYATAGAAAAAPIFGATADMLINDFDVLPITH